MWIHISPLQGMIWPLNPVFTITIPRSKSTIVSLNKNALKVWYTMCPQVFPKCTDWKMESSWFISHEFFRPKMFWLNTIPFFVLLLSTGRYTFQGISKTKCSWNGGKPRQSITAEFFTISIRQCAALRRNWVASCVRNMFNNVQCTV